jgi:transcriptional regulator with XRE-family HTH domain
MQTQSKRPHVGRNIQTIRYIRGISQLDLGVELEEKLHKPFSQQLVSDIEGRQNIEDEELLAQIAEILKVTPEALKNMEIDNAINVIGNTYTNTNNDYSSAINQPVSTTINQTINPLDRLIELFEKEKAELRAENERLRKELAKKKK